MLKNYHTEAIQTFAHNFEGNKVTYQRICLRTFHCRSNDNLARKTDAVEDASDYTDNTGPHKTRAK